MNQRLLYILCVLFSASCGTEKPEPDTSGQTQVKTTDTDEVMVPVDTTTEKVIHIIPGKKWTFQQKSDSFILAYHVNYDEQVSQKRSVLMRFENAWMKQVLLVKRFSVPHADSVLFPHAEIGFYAYADSSQRANAMSNWLACFGTDCKQVIPGEDVKLSSAPGFYIINEKEIITLDYPATHQKNNWMEMKKNLRVLFANPASTIIEINAQGYLTWIK
ncbi:MAG: hypothetical protein ACHQF2_00470 [Flavobacteriales bacterium]